MNERPEKYVPKNKTRKITVIIYKNRLINNRRLKCKKV